MVVPVLLADKKSILETNLIPVWKGIAIFWSCSIKIQSCCRTPSPVLKPYPQRIPSFYPGIVKFAGYQKLPVASSGADEQEK